MLSASALLPAFHAWADWGATSSSGLSTRYSPTPMGYGTDPDLLKPCTPGGLWPLIFTRSQCLTATTLSDLIIPADEDSPSASQVGVIDFLNEWISAPYPLQRQDRDIVLRGFEWLDHESSKRFRKSFHELDVSPQHSICDDICLRIEAKSEFAAASEFFARYRDLTSGGFYTAPEGRKDLRYIGNVPLANFDGPPLEVLRKVGLT
jgi:hypothetical protein